MAGTGTILPGLTTNPTPQTFTFSGSGAGTLGGTTGTYSCGFNGNDTIGTLLAGSRSFSGSCNTPCGTVGVSGSYDRSGATLNADGSINSGCLAPWTITVTCHFGVTGTPPWVTFYLICVIRW